jgi:hypothetical protein
MQRFNVVASGSKDSKPAKMRLKEWTIESKWQPRTVEDLAEVARDDVVPAAHAAAVLPHPRGLGFRA